MIRACLLSSAAAFILLGSTLYAQDKVAEGSALFTSQKCILCHSVEGKGNKKGPLDDVGARLKAADIRAWLTTPDEMRAKTKATRSPAMKNFSSLSKDQIEALVIYLLAQRAVNADNSAR